MQRTSPHSLSSPSACRALSALGTLILLAGAPCARAAEEGRVGEMVRIRKEVLGRELERSEIQQLDQEEAWACQPGELMWVRKAVKLNMTIETKEDSLAEVVFDTEGEGELDGSLHLGPETCILVEEGEEKSLLQELFGRLLVALSPSAQRRNIEVKTPTAVIGIRGTLAGISVDRETGATRVSVFEGSVEVRAAAGGAPQVVEEGFRCVVEKGRRPSLPAPNDPSEWTFTAVAEGFGLPDPTVPRDPGERPVLPRDQDPP